MDTVYRGAYAFAYGDIEPCFEPKRPARRKGSLAPCENELDDYRRSHCCEHGFVPGGRHLRDHGCAVFRRFLRSGLWLTLSLIRRFRTPRSTMLVIALPLMFYPFEPLLQYEPHEGAVTTVIDIAASPEVVWQQTAEIRHVRPDELSWTFSHGIVGVPQPVDARLEGEGVGAVRQLEWTRGVKFQEIVTRWEENRLLARDFRFGTDSIPAAVEAHINVDSSYLKLTNGDYHLEALPNGHTRLTLTTRYRIATPINFYCDLWGKVFLNDFHGVVLKVIRDRSQRIAAAS